MSTEPGNPTSVRCRSCGIAGAPVWRRHPAIGRIYQIVIACATCGTSFVAISRN